MNLIDPVNMLRSVLSIRLVLWETIVFLKNNIDKFTIPQKSNCFIFILLIPDSQLVSQTNYHDDLVSVLYIYSFIALGLITEKKSLMLLYLSQSLNFKECFHYNNI